MRKNYNEVREQVFDLIDGERDYQDNKPEHSQGQDAKTSVAAWVIYIRKHLALAEGAIYFLDEGAALAEIRKIAALCVACMENNETRSRLDE